MTLAASKRLPLLLAVLACCAAAPLAARAEDAPAPPLPGQNEAPEEIEARVHYERALRAELDGRLDEAEREAKATADAVGGRGRFADSARALQARVAERRARGESSTSEGESTGIGTRVEFVSAVTGVGILSSIWLALAADVKDSRAFGGILTLGGVASLGGAILATRGVRVRQSWSSGVSLGAGYAVTALSLGMVLGNGIPDKPFAAFLGATVLGAGAGLLTAMYAPLTGGDAGAAYDGFVFGGLVPFLVAVAAGMDDRGLAGVALAGTTIGMVGATVLNHSLNWSRGRWNLIGLGGGVGFLVGLGTSLLIFGSSNDGKGYVAVWAAGTVAGLGLTAWLTDGWSADERRVAANALFDWRPGRGLGVGNVWSAVAPALLPGKSGHLDGGVMARAFEARF